MGGGGGADQQSAAGQNLQPNVFLDNRLQLVFSLKSILA